jgi:group I intron endonuclease
LTRCSFSGVVSNISKGEGMKNVIYKIRNVVNGHFYVGSTVDSRKRFWAHRRDLRLNRHACIHLQRAWNKHGEDCFKFEVIQQLLSKEELFPAEQKLLDENFGKEHCYNTAKFADAPMRDASEALRARLAEKTKAWLERDGHPRQGAEWTKEQRVKIAESRTGKTAGPDHYRYGKTVSEEVRKKIGDAQRGVKKAERFYTPDGLARAQENMRRNARKQKPLDFSEILPKFPKEVLEKYDFTNAVYTGALVRVTGIICPEHGEFSNYVARFKKGFGCPQCGALIRAEKKRQEMLKTWATEEGRNLFLDSRKRLDTPEQSE